jgi:hypothetical protein
METVIFDATYRSLSGITALVLLVTAGRALRLRHQSRDGGDRSVALAVAVTALAVELALVMGVGLNEIRASTGDLFYQQAHFAVFYLAFALIVAAVYAIVAAARRDDLIRGPGRAWSAARLVGWGAFGLAVAIAGAFLLQAGALPGAIGGHVPQQAVFYLPVFVVLGLAALVLGGVALTRRGPMRAVCGWFAAFAALAFLGMLREATILPSSGEPLVELLVAFGPFTAASICLLLGGRSVQSLREAPAAAA